MADKGPLLTSCIIFYLSIGAAIFQILEEPNWESARDRYQLEKERILKRYRCLSKDDLDQILEIVSEAAGQGVAITGDRHKNSWDWGNSVIFAATIVTTIGYGNVAPKTKSGRGFCILYGLCGIPLCLVWISELGSFFGDRTKRLSGVLIRRGVSVKKVQLTCIALFLLWGLFVHLLIPPLVFMKMEGWSYLEGLYFSFITLTTVGFGDYVAGVNPSIEYPRLYRVFAEIWIYMGLAWLSLFFSWNVHMVVKAHEVLRKRRQRYRPYFDEEPPSREEKASPTKNPNVIDIFKYLSKKDDDDYNTIITEIGSAEKRRRSKDSINRSKSCSDILGTNIRTLEQSPRHRRMISISEVFMTPKAKSGQLEKPVSQDRSESRVAPEKEEDGSAFGPTEDGITFTVPVTEEPPSDSGGSRFTISKVDEEETVVKDEEKL
ncbi:potassium channel subfamily K member 5-like [Synchiropus picturatus]